MKTKKLFVLLLAFCLLMTSLAGCADILSLLSPDPDYLSYTVKDGKATVTGADKSISGHIKIPAFLGGYPVTAIAHSAFKLCTDLEGITIPYGVTHIGSGAFSGCSSLNSISVPDSLTHMDSLAFMGCDKLQYTVYEDGNYLGNSLNPYVILMSTVSQEPASFNVHRATKFIYDKVFIFNKNLTSITLPYGLTGIGSAAFHGCSSLKEITIPNSIVSIDGLAFTECSSLETINIPNKIKYIGNAFRDCDNLQYNIYENGKYLGNATNPYVLLVGTVSPDVTSFAVNPATKFIGSYAFAGHFALREITIGDRVECIGFRAFSYCEALKEIHIPNSVERIHTEAFQYCSALESITIPEGIESIGEYTFQGCSSLKSITVPNSVVSIGGAAFEDCNSLRDVFYCGSEANWANISIDWGNELFTGVTITYDYTAP